MHLPSRAEMTRRINGPKFTELKDPRASFDPTPLNSTDDFAGKCILVHACECCQESPCLVEVEEVKYVETPAGFRYLGRLAGKVVSGDVPWKSVNINRLDYYAQRGWKEARHLGGYLLGFEGTEFEALVKQARYHVLNANGFKVVAQTALDLVDLGTDAAVNFTKDIKTTPSCERIVTTRCTNFICQDECQVEEGLILTDCYCPESWFVDNPLSSCYWMDWARCVTISCPGRERCASSLFWCTCQRIV